MYCIIPANDSCKNGTLVLLYCDKKTHVTSTVTLNSVLKNHAMR